MGNRHYCSEILAQIMSMKDILRSESGTECQAVSTIDLDQHDTVFGHTRVNDISVSIFADVAGFGDEVLNGRGYVAARQARAGRGLHRILSRPRWVAAIRDRPMPTVARLFELDRLRQQA